MKFSSEIIYIALRDYGFQNLPNKQYWSEENSEILAEEIIKYLVNNLDNKDVWIKFSFLLEAIFNDSEFSIIFTNSLGEYLGNQKFAEGLIERAITGELMWSYDCYELITRLEKIHNIYIDKVNKEESDN